MILELAAGLALAPQLIRLSNGAPVVILPEPHAPTVSIQALFNVGDLSPDELGATELLCQAMFTETEGFSPRAIRNLAWMVGGNVGASLDGDVVRIEVTTQPSHLEPALTLLSEVVRRPVFTDEALGRAAAGHNEWLRKQYASPSTAASRKLLSGSGIGPADVAALTAAQAENLHLKVIRPDRMAIAVAGNVEPEAVAVRISRTIGNWSPDAPRRATQAYRKTAEDSPWSPIGVFYRGPDPKSAEFPAWLVLTAVLGQGKGSLLSRFIRDETGAAYVVAADVGARSDGSWAAVYSATAGPAAEHQAAALLLARSVESVLDADMVERAKGFVIGNYAVGHSASAALSPFNLGAQSASRRAFRLAWWQLHTGAHWNEAQFLSTVERVSLEDVRAAAELYLRECGD